MVEAALLNKGWHLSKEGLERCRNGTSDSKAESIIHKALDIDLRHIGLAAVPADINKGKIDKIQGPLVLQIQKIRNVSAPKANEESGAAPPLLRLQLTDGHTVIMALVLSNIDKIGLSTPPGSKMKITGSVSYNHGFLLLLGNNCSFLGGKVEELVQRWELAKSLYHHTRSAVSGNGGPPPWVPFGQRHRFPDAGQKSTKITMKKSLEDPKPKEQTEQDKEFAEQRKAAIQEINKSKQGQQGKTFGGTKTASTAAPQMRDGRDQGRRDGRDAGRKGFDNDRRDGGRGSKWKGDQAEGQSTAAKPRSDGIYRDLDYGGYQPSEKEIQQLVGMGFKRDAASNALRKHAGNADAAVEMLLMESSASQPQAQAIGRQRQDTRPERGHGNGRRGRRGDDEDEEASAPPAAPATLFDFLQPKLGKDKEKGSSHPPAEAVSGKEAGRTRNYEKEQPRSVREAGITFMHGGEKGQSSNYRQSAQQQGYQKDCNTGRRAGNSDQKSGSERKNYNNQRSYDDRVRNQDRGYDNRESNTYKDRNTYGDRRDNNRQGGGYQPRRDNMRGGHQPNNNSRGNYNDDRGPPRDTGSRGHDGSEKNQQRPGRSKDFKGDYQDNRPPRFQKQNNTQGKNDFPPPRREERDERPRMNNFPPRRDQRNERPQMNNPPPRREQRDERPQMSNPPPRREQRDEQPQMSIPPPRREQRDEQPQMSNPPPRREQRDDWPQMSRDGRNQPAGYQPPQPANHLMGSGQTEVQQRPNLNPGDQCQARYWEDNQYYNAVLTAVHPSGKTCVVLFPDYGNHEEVKISDIRPLQSQPRMNPSKTPQDPKPSFLMSDKGGVFEGSMSTHLEFRQGGEGTAYNKQRDPRKNVRPSQNFYQPPTSRK